MYGGLRPNSLTGIIKRGIFVDILAKTVNGPGDGYYYRMPTSYEMGAEYYAMDTRGWTKTGTFAYDYSTIGDEGARIMSSYFSHAASNVTFVPSGCRYTDEGGVGYVGGNNGGRYWSGSAYDATYAWFWYLSTNSMDPSVRCVRNG